LAENKKNGDNIASDASESKSTGYGGHNTGQGARPKAAKAQNVDPAELEAEADLEVETDGSASQPEAENRNERQSKTREMPPEIRLELELKATRLELEIKKLENEAAKRAVENASQHMKRLTDEFDNYRRRTEENNKKLKEDGIIEAVKKLIDVYDTVKIAVDMTNDEAAKAGMNMVLKKFKDGLYGLGVSEIESEGCTFDPNYHDALICEPAPEGVESGMILQVLNEGFVINGRVLRHAAVKVAM